MLVFKTLFTFFKACCSIGSGANENSDAPFNTGLFSLNCETVTTLNEGKCYNKRTKIKQLKPFIKY